MTQTSNSANGVKSGPDMCVSALWPANTSYSTSKSCCEVWFYFALEERQNNDSVSKTGVWHLHKQINVLNHIFHFSEQNPSGAWTCNPCRHNAEVLWVVARALLCSFNIICSWEKAGKALQYIAILFCIHSLHIRKLWLVNYGILLSNTWVYWS